MNVAIFRVFGYPRLYGMPVTLPSQHPQLKVFRHLQYPMPAYTDLTAQARLASVGRDEDFQTFIHHFNLIKSFCAVNQGMNFIHSGIHAQQINMVTTANSSFPEISNEAEIILTGR